MRNVKKQGVETTSRPGIHQDFNQKPMKSDIRIKAPGFIKSFLACLTVFSGGRGGEVELGHETAAAVVAGAGRAGLAVANLLCEDGIGVVMPERREFIG